MAVLSGYAYKVISRSLFLTNGDRSKKAPAVEAGVSC